MKSREDIVKGLECCLKAGICCEACAYYGKEDLSKYFGCKDLLLSDALELIKSDGERLEAPTITEGRSKEELLGDTCGDVQRPDVVEAPKQCEDCAHYPICEWCNENTSEFNWSAEEDVKGCSMRMPYSMFKVHGLDETVDGMLSKDYKERFKAEYQQLKIRVDKLNNFCNRIAAANNSDKVKYPEHDCSLTLLKQQLDVMRDYLHILEIRAIIEGIEL